MFNFFLNFCRHSSKMCSLIARSLINKFVLNNSKNVSAQQKRLDSYKAAVLKIKDSNPVFEITKQKAKKLGDNDVRVEVNFCSLNANDIVRYQNSKSDFVPGFELSGEVVEIGSKVTPEIVTKGERVAVLSKNRGGFAEQCVVDAKDVWRLPSNVKRKDAAVIIFSHTNAMYAFSHFTSIQENTKIIITTGPAGVGLAAVDVTANIFKTKPVGICQSEELAALVRERGAFVTSTFANKHLAKEFTGYDIIYDALGGSHFKTIAECVKPGGIIMYAGPMYETVPLPPPNVWLSHINIEGLRQTDPEFYRNIVSETLDLADEGTISAYISSEFKLSNINEGVKFIKDKKCTGKVLIQIDDD